MSALNDVLTLTSVDGQLRPTWQPGGGGGSGITQLTGDVLAGPGSGPQAAVIQGQGGNSGKFLTTNGTSVSWANVTAASVGWFASIFGTGSDGDLTISSGTTTLQRDMYYNNLTISGSGVLNCNGYRVHVNGTLDLSAAPSGAIIDPPINTTTNGNLFFGGTGGSASNNQGSLGFSTDGTSGASGGNNAAGTPPSSATGTNPGNGGSGATGGAGGDSGTLSGASGGTVPTANTKWPVDWLTDWVSVKRASGGTSFTGIKSGSGSNGGASGAGDAGPNFGGGGGGGGAGGGWLWIAARTIARGTNSNAGIITVAGGAGGSGASGGGGTAGGGGGGAGGGGGVLTVAYLALTGSVIVNALDVSGGAGGAGGNGVSTGKGGGGGGAGGSGLLNVFDLGAGTNTNTAVTAPVNGTAQSANATGVAGQTNVKRVNL